MTFPMILLKQIHIVETIFRFNSNYLLFISLEKNINNRGTIV